jgi:hypothetical protein
MITVGAGLLAWTTVLVLVDARAGMQVLNAVGEEGGSKLDRDRDSRKCCDVDRVVLEA